MRAPSWWWLYDRLQATGRHQGLTPDQFADLCDAIVDVQSGQLERDLWRAATPRKKKTGRKKKS